jgi:pSer/pThr/pTyr-binding forkhead associated (FHA) protein
MSRFHTQVTQAAGGIHVRDLNSSNGTFVNEEPITDADMRRGDKLRVGRTIFTFELETATGVHLTAATATDESDAQTTSDSGAL